MAAMCGSGGGLQCIDTVCTSSSYHVLFSFNILDYFRLTPSPILARLWYDRCAALDVRISGCDGALDQSRRGRVCKSKRLDVGSKGNEEWNKEEIGD